MIVSFRKGLAALLASGGLALSTGAQNYIQLAQELVRRNTPVPLPDGEAK